MANATLEKILEDVRALTPDEQRQLREMLNKEAMSEEQARRAALIKSIRGKYAHVPTSSEEFAERKQVEIDLEDRHRFDVKGD